MFFFDIGKLPGQQSMIIFHALARMGIEALVLVSPQTPLVSIGYFQDAEKEVDLRTCGTLGIPVMRREVGGGATYLDDQQIFYQLIWKRNNPRFPPMMKDAFPWFSEAVVETYRSFGIQAAYRSVNDIVTKEGKKIAGEGGGDIGGCMVFVGGVLLDFNFKAMGRILNVPDEKFRDKIYKTLDENLTTMKRELGSVPPREDVIRVLREAFERRVGRLEEASMNFGIVSKIAELEAWMTSDEFLHKKTAKIPKGVKIREGVEILHGLHKAKGGLIRSAEQISENKILDVTLSGDFMFSPKEALAGVEKSLWGNPLEEDRIVESVAACYEEKRIESPGVDSLDFAKALLNPLEGGQSPE